ncbi:tRNA (guanosine(37)-N1)-methyltransferase TrmD [Rhodovulum sp. 12E13]|uniref:tRNA (guanosine(37)-N1)-methyltransferase TrmD n=1 Tax=Rhodovulum sp. 12E13 TaxID=2203891 RepID=UPI000E12798A|nr:tRNA (guanosine(37)-N1)-methyltransferase TrmD [Rhodovulum sp. 12E13]RDC74807.1 tRNA (guanosine(37)-N1)-methyltransferase TrmD [Rhodovulum sp. 12E13]
MPDTPRQAGRSHGRLSIAPSTRPRDLMDDRPALAGAWTAQVITLFPQLFPGPLGASLTGRALDAGLWRLETLDLRRFGEGKHRNVDDTPAGGGAGMVLRADVVDTALAAAGAGVPPGADWPVIYLSPRGTPLTQGRVRRLAEGQGVTLLCGRFEGVDERVLQARQIEEVSLGDFVMTGGEIAAHALIDATVRLIPRVLGNQASTEEESFSEGLLEHPQYTRPTVWQGRAVPDILLSGHHAEIARWRKAEAERLTRKRRPDLWRAYLERQGRDPDGDREL